MVLNAALDDAGHNTDHAAYAGYVGFPTDWEALQPHWVRALRQKRLAFLQTAKYLQANPPPEGLDTNEIQSHHWRLIQPFATVIRRHGLFAICVAVDRKAWLALPKDQQRLCGDPTALAFQIFIANLFAWSGSVDSDDVLTLMVDEGRSNSQILGTYKTYKSKAPLGVRRMLGSISFGDESRYPALQTADLLANFFHKEIRNLPQGGNAAFSRLAGCA